VRRGIHLGARALLGGLFCASGAYKILDPVGFREFLLVLWPFVELGSIPRGLFVGALGFSELAIGVSLLTPSLHREAALTAAVFLVAATVLVVPQMWEGMECRCFPVPMPFREGGLVVMVRNAALLGLALWIWRGTRATARSSRCVVGTTVDPS